MFTPVIPPKQPEITTIIIFVSVENVMESPTTIKLAIKVIKNNIRPDIPPIKSPFLPELFPVPNHPIKELKAVINIVIGYK